MNLLYKKTPLICPVIVLLFFAVTITASAQEQTPPDTVKAYPGIPLITYAGGIQYPPAEQFELMEEAGIFAMQATDLKFNDFNQKIANTNLLVMPEQIDTSVTHYIYRYTEAVYTVWEAEGTPEEDGLVTLYSDSIDSEIYNGTVRTTNISQEGTLIYGPMYRQEKHYGVVAPGQPIEYKAKYRLKLEDVDPWQESSPEDTICILQVTTTRTWDDSVYWGFHDIYVIKDSAITYGDFISINQWQEFDLDYDLMNVPNEFHRSGPEESLLQHPFIVAKNSQAVDRQSVNCVEFKVIWKGNPNVVRLSVDKIIVFDERGWDIMTDENIQGLIVEQLNENRSDFGENRIAGWIGIDEPWNLDFWGPIRKVSEIIDANSTKAKLWFQFNTSWNGRFGDYNNSARSMKVVMIDEFMRRVKKANVWVTSWIYDLPCTSGMTYDYCSGDFRIRNIDFAADSLYKKVVEAGALYPNLQYGISVQTGRYKYYYNGVPENRIREISGQELLYQTNLALIYGSKLISPWLYFGGCNDPETSCYTGFRNSQDNPPYKVTDKYNTLKDTIAPRLNGLMGKTLRKLKPIKQFAGSNGIDALIDPQSITTPYEYIDYIEATGGPNDDCLVELGIFQDPQDASNKFFMPLNRYYSTLHNLTFGLRYLAGYNNWKVTDFVDTTHFTILSDQGSAEFNDVIYPEDAKLYGFAPTVKYGGTLAVNDTVSSTITLLDKMTISNSAELYLSVNADYFLTDTVTLEGSGFIKGLGYVFKDSTSDIVTNSWSRSLFKSRQGNNPKFFWGEYQGTYPAENYKIFRKEQNQSFVLIATIPASQREYIDTAIVIITGPPGINETAAEYYVKAVYINQQEEGTADSEPTNTIKYQRVDGDPPQKRAEEVGEIYTYSLSDNYPNPFNPTTVIRYSVADLADVKLVIYDILGREIKVLVDETKEPGNYEIHFNADNLASGVYINHLPQ